MNISLEQYDFRSTAEIITYPTAVLLRFLDQCEKRQIYHLKFPGRFARFALSARQTVAFANKRGWLTGPASESASVCSGIRELHRYVTNDEGTVVCKWCGHAASACEAYTFTQRQRRKCDHSFKYVIGVGDRCEKCGSGPTRKHKRGSTTGHTDGTDNQPNTL